MGERSWQLITSLPWKKRARHPWRESLHFNKSLFYSFARGSFTSISWLRYRDDQSHAYLWRDSQCFVVQILALPTRKYIYLFPEIPKPRGVMTATRTPPQRCVLCRATSSHRKALRQVEKAFTLLCPTQLWQAWLECPRKECGQSLTKWCDMDRGCTNVSGWVSLIWGKPERASTV